MKKFFNEFKNFAIRGNMIDMAIGMIIATAFSGLVKSLTDCIINPILGLIFQINLDNLGVTVALADKKVFFAFGSFISAVINFFILAFVLFCFLKLANKFKKKEEEKPVVKEKSTNELLSEILEELKMKKMGE